MSHIINAQSHSLDYHSLNDFDRFILPIPEHKIESLMWQIQEQCIRKSRRNYDQYLKNQMFGSQKKIRQRSKNRPILQKYSFSQILEKHQQIRPIIQNDKRQVEAFKIVKFRDKIINNFYLNLLDWSPKNIVGVCFLNYFHFIKPLNQQYFKNISVKDQKYLTSIKFDDDHLMAIGNCQGQIAIWDIQKMKQISTIHTYNGAINCLAWFNSVIASGNKSGYVSIWDKRMNEASIIYNGHYQQTCGIKWNKSGDLLATGGNDINLLIYDIRKNQRLINFQCFKGAVKAIDWCPNNPQIVAAGGGTMDKTIRFFNTKTLKLQYEIKTNSQICNLAFSKISKQMVTCHGYVLNQINVWNSSNFWRQAQTVQNIGTLIGQKSRVLNFAFNQQGDTMATTGGNTIRFWHPFKRQKLQQQSFLQLKDIR